MNSALLDVALSEVWYGRTSSGGQLADVPYPIIPGHVSVGVLRSIRGAIADVNGPTLLEGDRITFLDGHRTRDFSWYCSVAKATTRRPQRKVYGITYGIGDGLSGGWAQSLHLKPESRCIRFNGVDLERFMASGCSLPTALRAVERDQICVGDAVLVLGSGPVGISIIERALLRGAHCVICVGSPMSRLHIAATVGASATLEFSACSVSVGLSGFASSRQAEEPMSRSKPRVIRKRSSKQ